MRSILVQLNKTGILYGFKEAFGELGKKYNHQHKYYGLDGFDGYGQIIDFMNEDNGEEGVLAEIIPFNNYNIQLSDRDSAAIRKNGFSPESRDCYLIHLRVNEEDMDSVEKSLISFFEYRKCPVTQLF